MANNKKNTINFDDSKWWQPSRLENIMLWLTILTVFVSIVSQASSLVNNFLQFDSVYKRLYPLLNFFHIYVLLYIIYSLRGIKKPIPENSNQNNGEYILFRKKLKQWIVNHFGKIYWEDKVGKKEVNQYGEEIYNLNKESFNKYVDKITKSTNQYISKTHKYFIAVFASFVLLYVFELINSFTYQENEPTLHILTIIFNNIATLFWFYIYLTLNTYETSRRIDQESVNEETGKRGYKINKRLYAVRQYMSFGKKFDRPNIYDDYEKGLKESLVFSKKRSWKQFGLIILVLSTAAFVYFIISFNKLNIVEIESIKNQSPWYYYPFRILSTLSILLGGCAMLAIFSRLSSGFKKVPLSAFLVMLFYAASQPLFFTGSEFGSASMKVGQILFIANLMCLIGKFGLLYLIKWFFANNHIAYYFVAEQIVKDKREDLILDELFYCRKQDEVFREINNNVAITKNEISKNVNISLRETKYYIRMLKGSGMIKRFKKSGKYRLGGKGEKFVKKNDNNSTEYNFF